MKLKKQKWSSEFEIRTYGYLSSEIRTIWVGDQTFFVAQDICEILGFSNTHLVCRVMPDDEKILLQMLVASQQRYMICITPSGLLSIIDKVKRPHAKKFLDWVARHVLPSVKNLEIHIFDKIAKSQKITNSSEATHGRYDIRFNLDLSLPPDVHSLAVLERITGINLAGCLITKKKLD